MEPAKQPQVLADERSFEHFYREHRADVYRFVLRDTGNREEAEDVTQTAFLNAYNAFLRSGPPEKPKAWLFAIAENVRRRRFRTQTRRPVETPLEYEPTAADTPDDIPTAHEIGDALARLPFNQRTALVLRELSGLSYAEIAEELNLSVSAVQMLIFRARRSLRAELEPVTGPRRVLGGILGFPLPNWLSKALTWLGGSVERAGLVPRAAGIIGAAVVGTSVVASTDRGHALSDAFDRERPAPAESRPAATPTSNQATQARAAGAARSARSGRPSATQPVARQSARRRAARPAATAAGATDPGSTPVAASSPAASAEAAPTVSVQQSGGEAPAGAGSQRARRETPTTPTTPLDDVLRSVPQPPELPRLPQVPPVPPVPPPPTLPAPPQLPELPPTPPVTPPPLPPVPPPSVPTLPVEPPPLPDPPLPPPPPLP